MFHSNPTTTLCWVVDKIIYTLHWWSCNLKQYRFCHLHYHHWICKSKALMTRPPNKIAYKTDHPRWSNCAFPRINSTTPLWLYAVKGTVSITLESAEQRKDPSTISTCCFCYKTHLSFTYSSMCTWYCLHTFHHPTLQNYLWIWGPLQLIVLFSFYSTTLLSFVTCSLTYWYSECFLWKRVHLQGCSWKGCSPCK